MHYAFPYHNVHMRDSGELPFVFSGPDLNRLAPQRNDEVWLEQQLTAPATRFVPVCEEHNVLLADGITPLLLDMATVQPALAQADCAVLLGNSPEYTYVALGLPAETAPLGDKLILTNLRPQFSVLDRAALAVLGYARAMVHWHRQNRYCGKCGAPTHSRNAGHELHCERCGNVLYPRVNPAIIVLVTHGDRCLLGRHTSTNRYSTFAGFVEPGESLEATVRREVQEETNIRVTSMHYRASQPWPYPASLMLGFRARAENTDIRCNDGELAEARWFSRADIALGISNSNLTLSTPQSIAYALLRDWFDAGGASLDALHTTAGSTRRK